MKLEEAKKYIKMIILRQEIPDSAKALGYVYAEEAIETVLNELDIKDAKVERLKNARDNWKKTYYQSEKELEKAKKVIEEMAEYFGYGLAMCENCEFSCSEKCSACIKEYFYKKVEKNDSSSSNQNK